MIRLAWWVAGVACVVGAWLWVDPTRPELLTGTPALPLAAAAVGFLLVGAAWRTEWRATAGATALLLVGYASALKLVDAPRYAVYQHYRAWSDLGAAWPWVAVVALQTMVCGVVLWRRRDALRFDALERIGWLRAVILLGFLAFAAAVPTVGLPRYVGETLLSLWVGATSLANIVLVGMLAPARDLRTLDGWIEARLPLAPHHEEGGRWQHRFAPTLALVATVVTAALCWWVLEAVPHIGDSVSYLFQARYLAEGHIYLPAPPDSAAFEMSHVVNDGSRWFSKYFPGWPAVLSFGVLVGAPWLVNPVLAGLTVLLAHACLTELDETWVANATVLLLVVSPWFLFMSSGFMGHPASLVWTLLAIRAVEWERRSGKGAWAALVGLCCGLLFLTRPLEGLLAAPVLGWWAWRGRRPGWRLRSFVACGVAGLLVASVILPFNRALTGDPLTTPFALWSELNYGPGADVLGFGPEVGIPDWDSVDPVPGHGPLDVVLNTNKNVATTHVELFGWPFGSLLLAALALVVGAWKPADRLFLALAAAVVLGHTVYWFPGGPDYGARYWYQALIPFVLFSVRGMAWLASAPDPATRPRRFRAVSTAVGAAVVAAVVCFVPWRAWGKHYRYRDIGRHPSSLVRTLDRPSLVFVTSDRFSDYEAVFHLNPIDLYGGATVIARDRGQASRSAVRQAFPERPVFELRRGPSDARSVLVSPDGGGP